MKSRKKKIKLVKFWVYDPRTERPVRLALKLGESSYFQRTWITDEGYSKDFLEYVRVEDSSEIRLTVTTDSRDCDGVHRSQYVGRINFSRGYRGLALIALNEDFPTCKTPRFTWD